MAVAGSLSAGSAAGSAAAPPFRCVLLFTGRPQTTPATCGPRRPSQDPPVGPGTPERLLPEVHAHPGAPPHPRLPGGPAVPPAWPRASGESELEEGAQAEPRQRIHYPQFKGSQLPHSLVHLKPASAVLCANRSQALTGQGPRRLYLRMNCPPGPSPAPRSLVNPSLGSICLGPTQCPTTSCECPPCGCRCLGTVKGH